MSQQVDSAVASVIYAVDGLVPLTVERGEIRHELQQHIRRIIAARDRLSKAIDNIIVAVAKPMEGAEGPADWWGGPLSKMGMKAALRQVEADMWDCTERSELDGLINTPATQALIKQCILDMPSWWDGRPGSDVIGINARIQQRYEELR